MNGEDRKEIASIVSDAILKYEEKRPRLVPESDCLKRTARLHDKLMEVHEDVRRSSHTITQVQIDLTSHVAEHRGETTSRTVLASRRSEVYKLLGLIFGSLTVIGGIVWAIASAIYG
jgi:hypothetical protein